MTLIAARIKVVHKDDRSSPTPDQIRDLIRQLERREGNPIRTILKLTRVLGDERAGPFFERLVGARAVGADLTRLTTEQSEALLRHLDRRHVRLSPRAGTIRS